MMNIKISSVNFDKTPAIEDYVIKKISSLEKFLDKEQQIICDVELGKTTQHHKSGDIFKTEVNILLPGNNQFYAVAEESDLYSAIDIVRDEIEREIIWETYKNNLMHLRLVFFLYAKKRNLFFFRWLFFPGVPLLRSGILMHD